MALSSFKVSLSVLALGGALLCAVGASSASSVKDSAGEAEERCSSQSTCAGNADGNSLSSLMQQVAVLKAAVAAESEKTAAPEEKEEETAAAGEKREEPPVAEQKKEEETPVAEDKKEAPAAKKDEPLAADEKKEEKKEDAPAVEEKKEEQMPVAEKKKEDKEAPAAEKKDEALAKENKDEASSYYTLIKPDVECKSGDTNQGETDSVQACSDAVEANGGKFFIYGKGAKARRCYKEKTSSASCPEGFESDEYDFYSITEASNRWRTTTIVVVVASVAAVALATAYFAASCF